MSGKNKRHLSNATVVRTVPQSKKARNWRRLLLIILIGALLLAVSTAGYKWAYKRLTTKSLPQACSEDQITQANNAINTQKVEELGEIVGEIKQQTDFDKDPNCLYIITEYDTLLSDPQKAEASYALLLERVAAVKNSGFKLAYSQEAIAGLGEDVKALQERANEFLKNQYYGPGYQHPDGYQNPNLQGEDR